MLEWYRSILHNPSHGQPKKDLPHLPSSPRNELFSAISSIPQDSIPPIMPTIVDYQVRTTPTPVTHTLGKAAISPLSNPIRQSFILGAPFSDPFIAQAFVEVMANRIWDHTVAPESTAEQAEKRQKLLPTEYTNLHGSDSHTASRGSAVESNSAESVSHAWRYPPHGNCKDEIWDDLFNRLACFKEKHGHCRVSQHYAPDIHLSQWVKRQRYYRKHRPGLMSERRIQKLNQLGFVWDAQEDVWKTRFEELKTFKLVHGHCNVPCKYSANQKMATWVKCQRRQYKLRTLAMPSSLTDERISLLEELGFVWKIRGLDVGIVDK
eukprot:scaffold3073_cov66-Cylindrotheca_fusiformis.AAC.27